MAKKKGKKRSGERAASAQSMPLKSKKKEQKLAALEQAPHNDVQRRWLRDYPWMSLEGRVARRVAELLPDDPAHPTAAERQRLGGGALVGPCVPDTLEGDLEKLKQAWEEGGKSAFNALLSAWVEEIQGR